jgi:hypothetical protein
MRPRRRRLPRRRSGPGCTSPRTASRRGFGSLPASAPAAIRVPAQASARRRAARDERRRPGRRRSAQVSAMAAITGNAGTPTAPRLPGGRGTGAGHGPGLPGASACRPGASPIRHYGGEDAAGGQGRGDADQVRGHARQAMPRQAVPGRPRRRAGSRPAAAPPCSCRARCLRPQRQTRSPQRQTRSSQRQTRSSQRPARRRGARSPRRLARRIGAPCSERRHIRRPILHGAPILPVNQGIPAGIRPRGEGRPGSIAGQHRAYRTACAARPGGTRRSNPARLVVANRASGMRNATWITALDMLNARRARPTVTPGRPARRAAPG